MALLNLIRLARPLNLLIIAATMYGLRWCIIHPLLSKNSPGYELRFSEFNFFLSVVVMMLLAAAGNVINDYFDQKVDRINRPQRVIVGKTVKRRVAMILHQALNVTAIIISTYLAWASRLWLAVIIPAAIATLLWWYSPVFKKIAFWGNFTVALCVAVVPLWAAMFEIDALTFFYSDMLMNPQELFAKMWMWIIVYSGFAFLLTLAREAQKDLEDISGDQKEGYRTLPILLGEKNTRLYAVLILGVAGIGIISLAMLFAGGTWFIITTLVMVAPILLACYMTLRAREKQDYHIASRVTKLAMATGIIFMIVVRWWILSA